MPEDLSGSRLGNCPANLSDGSFREGGDSVPTHFSSVSYLCTRFSFGLLAFFAFKFFKDTPAKIFQAPGHKFVKKKSNFFVKLLSPAS